MPADPLQFYEALAHDYHLIFADWNKTIERQGYALDRLLRAYTPGAPLDILDCSCGIGTQTLALAAHGYHVHGTDLSPAAVERAIQEAAARHLPVTFGVADMRMLDSQVGGAFDVVLSCDNAVPHLLTDDDLRRALGGMRARLRQGGLLLISIRDYDQLILEKPRATLPQVYDDEAGRRIVFQVWDWAEPLYTLNMIILRQRDGADDWQTSHYATIYRALQRAELDALLAACGFTEIRWLMPQDTGYYQPVVVARVV